MKSSTLYYLCKIQELILLSALYKGTVVGKIEATDKDEPNTLHTKIKFTLKNGTNLFRIDPYSGVITASTNTLDREVLPA